MIFDPMTPMDPPFHPHFASSGSPVGPSLTTNIWKGSLLCVPEGPAPNPHQLLQRAGFLGKLAGLEPHERPRPLQAAALDGRMRWCTWNGREQSGGSAQHVAKGKG